MTGRCVLWHHALIAFLLVLIWWSYPWGQALSMTAAMFVAWMAGAVAMAWAHDTHHRFRGPRHD